MNEESQQPQSQQSTPPKRTPLFEALHADRYQRQGFIREVEDLTNRRLLVYFGNVNHPASAINNSDVAPLQDLLTDCEEGDSIDLLIQSNGGDGDVAEKLVQMIRQRASSFRVIVAERAKSAGTMIALGSDSIIMGAASELGPIDPQIQTFTPDGQPIWRAAKSYLDGLEQIKNAVANEGQLNPAYYPLLSQLDPALLDWCSKAIDRAEEYAEKWLSAHMLKERPDVAKEIAHRLVDAQQYRSHGMVINWKDAQDLGLTITHLKDEEELWQQIWRLHLAYEVKCRTSGVAKIFESRRVSVAMG